MSNPVILPSLRKLKISNFSLYPNGLNFEYNFVNGLNLIVGGNGTGKTTFINMLKYALVGLYKQEHVVKRRLEERIEKRENLPYSYFKSRMDATFALNNEAFVELTFQVADTVVTVRRSLFEPTVSSVLIKTEEVEQELSGTPITQYRFDWLFRHDPKAEEYTQCLQREYENKITSLCNLPSFDHLIFLVNNVLLFGEDRKTILWDSEIQKRLANNYFNDQRSILEREEASRSTKYFDSLARHKSEDRRAVKKVLQKLLDLNKDGKDTGFKELVNKREELSRGIEHEGQKIDQIQKERKEIEQENARLYNVRNATSKTLNEQESRKRSEETMLYKQRWKSLHPKYHIFKKYAVEKKDCPLCNQHLPQLKYESLKALDHNCILCENEIADKNFDSVILKQLTHEIAITTVLLKNTEEELLRNAKVLNELDVVFSSESIKLNALKSEFRSVQYSLKKLDDTDVESDSRKEFEGLQSQIEVLEQEMKKLHEQSDEFKEVVNRLDEKIDERRVEVREKLSAIFMDFGNRFLGVNCSLTYTEDESGVKNYVPKINGTERYTEDELSESQRFFIDQSFRMSVLDYFYKYPSFFICETPDSSLDISYERNAASIFLRYLEKPNALIITSNFNNSEFLKYIVENADQIGIVNLLQIGKTSTIQAEDDRLMEISNQIEALIKHRNGD